MITELSRGQKGSIFSDGEFLISAINEGRTVGGLQIWRIIVRKEGRVVEDRVVHLKNRSELKQAIFYAVSAARRKA